MNLGGYNLKGCIKVKVVGYELIQSPSGQLTDITSCTLLLSYVQGPPIEITVDLEMNLQAFLRLIAAINVDLERRSHHRAPES